MADEPFALSTVAPRSEEESDYEAICAAVMESARGRWFLEEYARRNRQADTALVLTAINRLEHLIQLERAGQGALAFRTVLLEMARTSSKAPRSRMMRGSRSSETCCNTWSSAFKPCWTPALQRPHLQQAQSRRRRLAMRRAPQRQMWCLPLKRSSSSVPWPISRSPTRL